MRALLIGMAAVVAGCGGEPVLDDGCDGEQPTLAECFAGYFFADCGGEGEARVACADGEGCRWFEGGCIPLGYTPSSCPADDVCCFDNWPYADEQFEGSWTKFFGMGPEEWDRSTSAVLGVTIDPTLAVVADSFACTGPPISSYTGPCEAWEHTTKQRVEDTLVAHFTDWNFAAGWHARIEVLPEGSGYTARLCAQWHTDVLQASCGAPGRRICAVAGTVQLSAFPVTDDEVLGTLLTIDATFASGMRVQAALGLPAT